MTKKHVTARRARLRELGEQDAANRCTFCKRDLPPSGAIHGWYGALVSARPVKFCNDSCAADYDDAEQAREARR